MLAETKHHKLSASKQQKSILSQAKSLKSVLLGRNQGVDRHVFPPGLWGTILLCLFQLLVAASVFGLVPISLQFLPCDHRAPSFVCEISLCFRPVWVEKEPQEVWKDTCGHIRSPR